MLRTVLERDAPLTEAMAGRLRAARERLDAPRPRAAPRRSRRRRRLRRGRGRLRQPVPASCASSPAPSTTLRAELGRALGHLNAASGGAVLTASADLLGSTSVDMVGADFPSGFWNAHVNPEARQLSVGGICEDAITGVLAGIASFGHAVGVGSSYGAFMAPLGHIAARLHAIGQQARQAASGEPFNPIVLVCGHAGLKTGEDGPTHADPQALQLLQQDFPLGTAISLTPWEPQEIWPLLATASRSARPSSPPFVTRPNETVLDREALGLAPAAAAVEGVYVLREPTGDPPTCTVVLQESAVTYAFVEEALPLLDREGHRRAGLLRRQRRALRSPAGGAPAGDLPRGARPGGDRHHRVHAADAVPLGALRRRPAPQACIPTVTATTWAAARGRWCCARPGWTARARPRRLRASSKDAQGSCESQWRLGGRPAQTSASQWPSDSEAPAATGIGADPREPLGVRRTSLHLEGHHQLV